MILYTIVPDEIVFGEGYNNASDNIYTEVEYMGEKVQVVQAVGNQYVIKRIISTSPKAFLNPGLQPGVIINI